MCKAEVVAHGLQLLCERYAPIIIYIILFVLPLYI